MPIERGFTLANAFRTLAAGADPQSAKNLNDQLAREDEAVREEQKFKQQIVAKSLIDALPSLRGEDQKKALDGLRQMGINFPEGVDFSKQSKVKMVDIGGELVPMDDYGNKVGEPIAKTAAPERIKTETVEAEVPGRPGYVRQVRIAPDGSQIPIEGTEKRQFAPPAPQRPGETERLIERYSRLNAIPEGQRSAAQESELEILRHKLTPERGTDPALVKLEDHLTSEQDRLTQLQQRGANEEQLKAQQERVARARTAVNRASTGGKGISFTTDAEGNTTFSMGGEPAGELTTSARKGVQETLMGAQDTRDELVSLRSRFDPSYFTIPGQVWDATLGGIDKAGIAIPEEYKQRLIASRQYMADAKDFLNRYIKAITGAAMTVQEAERIRTAVIDAERDGPTTFMAKLDAGLARARAAELRAWRRLSRGIEKPIQGDADAASLDAVMGDFNEAFNSRVAKAKAAIGSSITKGQEREIVTQALTQTQIEVFGVPRDRLVMMGSR